MLRRSWQIFRSGYIPRIQEVQTPIYHERRECSREPRMASLELFGSSTCLYASEMREWLEWRGSELVEYDFEADAQACERMRSLAQVPYTVPQLVEDGRVIQVGW